MPNGDKLAEQLKFLQNKNKNISAAFYHYVNNKINTKRFSTDFLNALDIQKTGQVYTV